MSEETLETLNTSTLIGWTDKRGNAWHFKASLQGQESNHYPGAIPPEDVLRRLFHWTALAGPVQTTVLTDDGVLTLEVSDRVAVVRPDTQTILGVHGSTYSIHQFADCLLDAVSSILDDELSIGSATLLKGGAVASVSVEVPENIITPEGVAFRPHLLAYSSHDGSLATSYKRVVTVVVCDNTLNAAINEPGTTVRIKHTTNSGLQLASARQALDIVHTTADAFSRQVAELCAIKVDEGAWARTLKSLAPIPPEDGAAKTKATRKALALDRLYRHDERCTPWQGTAYGVIQTVNTWAHHEMPIKGTERTERNMLKAIDGSLDKLDAGTLTHVMAAI